ncbi:hypothetical protein Tsubulata_020215, partial [Turnera subulata]
MVWSYTWTCVCRGDLEGILPPVLGEASHFFPPRPSSLVQNHISFMERITEGNYITRRFVFDSKAIASLKAMAANGNPKVKTSRVETLSCFMSATKAQSSGSLKPSVLAQVMNLRQRTKPPMSDASIGNNFWYAFVLALPTDEKTELHDLGAPFLEAQVSCRMLDYLKHHEIESLNLLLPCKPCINEDLSVPIIACQVSVFSWGGIALGLSLSHKIFDAGTAKAFLFTWASISRGDAKGIVPPALSEASQFFPPRPSSPQNHLSLMESIWFREANFITRKFVFDAKAIAALKAKAADGKPATKTSRIVTLSCFIWKCYMSATKALPSDYQKPSILIEAMNLRQRTKPPMSAGSIGNNFWFTTAIAHPMDEETELHDLVNLLNEAISIYDSDYTQRLQGEAGAETIAEEFVKPTSPDLIQLQDPYKLSILDQLTPTTYIPSVYFYPSVNDPNSVVIELKKSLSHALDLYYPLAGRVVDNLFIEHFNEGVPFLEAQVSVFSCGGIALGLSPSHKLLDGGTAKAFLFTWASISRGDLEGIVPPALSEASQFFPPKPSSPQDHLSLTESLWFTEGNYVTRRFVFDAKAIASLKEKAGNGNPEAKASRIVTLSCFIWKCCMSATKALPSAHPKASILVEAVNLRQRTKPPMSDGSIGNNFWWTAAIAHPMDEKSTELYNLVDSLNEAIAVYDNGDSELQGEEGAENIAEYCSQLQDFVLDKPDIFAFTSWLGLTNLKFSWGAPC